MDSQAGRVSESKYVLSRRESDGHNEVLKAGPKAPSEMGIVDFHNFLKQHGLHYLEVAQFLKVTHTDIRLMVDHGGWIGPNSKKELLWLVQHCHPGCRKAICTFLMRQEGNAGQKNSPHPHDGEAPNPDKKDIDNHPSSSMG